MKLVRYLAVALIPALTPSCFVYSDDLLGGEGGDGSGGSGNGSNGGSGNSNGDGGTGNTGNTGGTGGNPDGGGSGGDGGTGSGGGDGGTGGGPAITLVDDLSSGLPSYFNPPFNGSWKREGQTMTTSPACSAAVWTNAIGDMIQDDPEEADNPAFHVQATSLDCWGVDIYLTLKDSGSPEAIDVSGYTGFRFRAFRANAEGTLKVALEDTASNYTAGDCGGGSPSADCNKHAVSASPTTLTDAWRTIEVPLSSFGTASASGNRSVPLNSSEVYAIHFTLDPAGTEADFWIDDVEFYTE